MIPGALYHPIFINILLMLMIVSVYQLNTKYSVYNRIHRLRIKNEYLAWIVAICIVLFFGFRPTNSIYLGDTGNYARIFDRINEVSLSTITNGDFLFERLILFCSTFTDIHGFFLIVATGYVIFSLLALRRLFANNVWVAFLMYISAYSFYSYGINGIRNGLAAAIFLLALSYSNRKWFAVVLMLIAVGIHKSLMLPVGALIISYFYTNSKSYIIFWLLSIPISLISGGFWEVLFAGLGFDNRLDYLVDTTYDYAFSATGFRWDFLLYSSVPIAVGYYVIFNRKITSKYYALLLNTYIISNVFWILVIGASFSNRFAYLSWFLYPVVLLYPFLKFPLWKNQYVKVAILLVLHFTFTYFMWLIGK